MRQQNAKGIGYWQTNGRIKVARLNKFFTECPKVDCDGGIVEANADAMVCLKCQVLYKSCHQNMHLDIDVMINDTTFKMLSSGPVTAQLLGIRSIDSYNHTMHTLSKKLESLAEKLVALVVKIDSNLKYVIESVRAINAVQM